MPDTFKALKWPYEYECDEHLFGGVSFFRKEEDDTTEKEKIIISPNWGNMFLTLDRETGKWKNGNCRWVQQTVAGTDIS